MSNIIWNYHYIGSGESININDEIDTTPDKFNRWQIVGSLSINTEIMEKYKWIGKYINVPFCHIEQKGCRGSSILELGPNFICRFPHIKDANLGFGIWPFHGETPNEVMKQLQESLDFLKLVLNNSK